MAREYLITLTIYRDNKVEEERRTYCTKEEYQKVLNKYFKVSFVGKHIAKRMALKEREKD